MSEPKGIAPTPKLGGRPGEYEGDCRSVDGGYDHDDQDMAWDDDAEEARVQERIARAVRKARRDGGIVEQDRIRRILELLIKECRRLYHPDKEGVEIRYPFCVRCQRVADALTLISEAEDEKEGRRWPAPGSVPGGGAAVDEEGASPLCGTCHKPTDRPARFCSNACHPRGEHEEGGE